MCVCVLHSNGKFPLVIMCRIHNFTFTQSDCESEREQQPYHVCVCVCDGER